MANKLLDGIAAARQRGLSDDEIWQYLQNDPQVQKALGSASPEDVRGYLFGQSPAAAPAAPQTAPQTSAPPAPAGSPASGGASMLSEAGRLAHIGAAGAFKGLAAAPGLLGDLESLGMLGAQKLGLMGEEPNILPTSGEMMGHAQDLMDFLGVSPPTPQGTAERYMQAAGTGIGGALALSPKAAATGAVLASGAASGVGAQAGAEMFPDSAVAPIIGGLVGGTVAQGLEGLVSGRAAQKTLSALDTAKGQAQELQNAATQRRLSYNDALEAANDAHSKTLAEASAARDAAAQAAEAAHGGLVQDTVKAFGGADTPFAAGSVVKDAAGSWLKDTFPKAKESIWAPVDAAVPGETPVPLAAFRHALGDISSDAGIMQSLTSDITPRLPAVWKQKLDAMVKGEEMGVVERATPTWDEARKLRTALGDMMGTPAAVKDIGEQNLAYMYASLTQDLRGAAKGLGDDALAQFDSANAQTKSLFDVARGTMSKLGDASAKPEQIGQSLLASGGKTSDLLRLRENTPAAADALASSAVSQGLWQKLSPESQAALMPDEAKRNALNSSFATRDAALQSANDQYQGVVQQSLQGISDLKSGHRQAMNDLAKQQLATKEQIQALQAQGAEAKAAASQNAIGFGLGSALQSLALGGIGENIGRLAASAGHSLPEFAGPLGGLALGAAPLGYALVRAAVRNPELLRDPAIGAIVGHELALQRQGGK